MGMRASDTAELSFQECRVPVDNLLGEEGRGFQQLAVGLQRERLVVAILALSGAAQALDDTVAYLRERQAFGEPLASRQALRHRVADLATELEAARQLVYHAAALFAGGEECVMEVSMAKLYATEVANRVAYHAVQLHGGYGYMREFPVEGFYRDVRLYPIASGSSEVMREIIAKRLPFLSSTSTTSSGGRPRARAGSCRSCSTSWTRGGRIPVCSRTSGCMWTGSSTGRTSAKP